MQSLVAMATPPSAKVAIHAFCTALQLVGLPPLAPEAVRQAKFGSGDVDALWRTLHDYVLLRLAGTAAGPTAASAVSGLWADIAREQLDDEAGGSQLGEAGQDMVIQQLTAWGCPEALTSQLASPDTLTTRHLLLALVWLAAQHNLFGEALGHMAMPPDTVLLLPPFPEDARGCMTSHQAYITAATSASSHASGVLSHMAHMQWHALDMAAASQQRPSHSSRAGSGRLQPTLTKAEAQQQQQQEREREPSSEAVACMWRAVEAGAQCSISMLGKARAALLSLQSHMDAITRLNIDVQTIQTASWPRGQPLTAFELRLLLQPSLLRQHTQALAAATSALQQQAQLVSGAHMFFKWACSVVAEEAALQPQGMPQQQQGPQAPGALATLASLPEAGSPTATTLVQRLQVQLTAITQAAPAALQRVQQPASGAGITAQHFRQLARTAVAAPTSGTPTGRASPEAAASSGAGNLPPGPPTGHTAPVTTAAWALPPDISTALAAAQAVGQAGQAQQERWVRERLLQRLGSSCSCRGGAAPPKLAYGLGPQPRAGAAGGGMVDDSVAVPDTVSETSRLMDLTLSVARSLAQVRGTHRQMLQAAGDTLSEHYTVVGL